MATKRTKAGHSAARAKRRLRPAAPKAVRALLEETALLRPLIKRVDADTIELRSRAEIVVTTNNLRSPRSHDRVRDL
jgi:hypothetical protein